MRPVSLLGVAAHLPPRVVTNDFFAPDAAQRRGMFRAPTTRRHVGRDDTTPELIEPAARALLAKLGRDPQEVDILLTNVTVPDQPFTGCGAEVAQRLGIRPRWIIDLHNTGCVSFVYMMELSRLLLQEPGLRTALLCNVQNAAGRGFSHPRTRLTSQAPVPGDGCGVGLVVASDRAPILSALHVSHGEWAADMRITAEGGRHYWEPGPSPYTVAFTEERVASIIERGNRLVPELVAAACKEAGVSGRDIDLLITNQPNAIFLRNWREALELPPERHHDTFDRYGNLFGAGIPVNLDDALSAGKLAGGGVLAMGGFSHAGDYAAAAVVRWPGGGS